MNATNAGASLPTPDLRGVTLACIDTANHALALRALALSSRSLAFGRTLFLTDAIPRGIDVPAPTTFMRRPLRVGSRLLTFVVQTMRARRAA